MSVIELEPGLAPTTYAYNRDVEHVLHHAIKSGNEAHWEYPDGSYASRIELPATETVIRHFIPPNATRYHKNYMEYLTTAFARHDRIVLTPDIVWNAILCEIAQGVIGAPDAHRALFTRDPDNKITIAVPVDSATDPLPLGAISSELRGLVPVDMNLFLPKFTTTDDIAELAHMAAFAETVTPYYNYMTFCCGYPAIRIDGSQDDYDAILRCATGILDEFSRVSSPLTGWMNDTLLPWVNRLVTAVRDNDTEYFKQILSSERCGSGGEIEVDGWWSRMYRKQPNGERKPENFSAHISRVPWENAETGRKFALSCGVFHSMEDAENFLNPKFGWMQTELYEGAK